MVYLADTLHNLEKFNQVKKDNHPITLFKIPHNHHIEIEYIPDSILYTNSLNRAGGKTQLDFEYLSKMLAILED
jgi:hypothetical protein